MITVHPGSHVHRLLQLLTSAGEIPASALSLLGNERVLTVLVHKLETAQDIRFDKDGPVYHVRLIQMSGKKGKRNIRLYRKGLPVLDGLYPGLIKHYLNAFNGHCFSGNRFHTDRNHRVAEGMALCMAAGAEMRPYVLPPLQKAEIRQVVPDQPSFYSSRYLKKTGSDETGKTAYTRVVGALFYPGGCYTAYNTRDAVMKWSGLGEVKAQGHLLELARMNAGIGDVSSALLFGKNADIALTTILESDKSRRPELRFDRIYRHIHFIPLDHNGVRLLKILVTPDWNEKLLDALFEKGQRSYNKGVSEYDAIVGGRKILSHLDGDIARLIRFRESLTGANTPCEIICFPWQTGFLRTYPGPAAGLRVLETGAVEDRLGI